MLPYIVKNNRTLVLLGKKKSFSTKDGYIHNNPGQIIAMGGNCKKSSPEKIVKSIKREFVEETGHYADANKIKLVMQKDYAVGFYKVTPAEFESFSKINKSKADEKYIEIDYTLWVDLSKALNIMKANTKIDFAVDKYLKMWQEKNWTMKSELKAFKNKMNRGDRDRLLTDLRRNLKSHSQYPALREYILRYVKKRSYVDWYVEMLKNIPNDMPRITIKRSPSTSLSKQVKKSPIRPKKPSPTKKSSPKNKYVPPQLRKKSPKKTGYVPPHLRKDMAPRFKTLL
jgi:hypothetical protein